MDDRSTHADDPVALQRLALRCARQVTFSWSIGDDRLEFGEGAQEFLAPGLLRGVRSGAEFVERVHPADRATLHNAIVDALKGTDHRPNHAHGIWEVLLRLSTDASESEPRWHWIAMRGDVTAFDAAGRGARISGVLFDETERETERRDALRTRDLYAMQGAINRAIVVSTDRETLLGALCEVAVAHGHFALAWVALCDTDARGLRVAAQAGAPADYPPHIEASYQPEGQHAHRPIGRAIHERSLVVLDDLLAADNAEGHLTCAIELGFRGVGCFPLFEGGVPIGALMVYSHEAGNFDPAMCSLLQGMGDDVSKALDHLHIQREQAETQRRLVESGQRFEQLVEHSPEGILVHIDGTIVLANSKLRSMVGHDDPNALIGTDCRDLLHADDIKAHEIRLDTLRRQGMDRVHTADVRLRRTDGSCIEAEMVASTTEFHGQRARQVLLRDIGERKRLERLQASQQAVLSMIAAREPLSAVLIEVARAIESNAAGVKCCVYVAEETGLSFAAAFSPSVPTDSIDSDDLRLIRADSPSVMGRAAHDRTPKVVEDVNADAATPAVRELRQRLGAKAVGAWPLLNRTGHLMGAIYLSLPRCGPPGAHVLQVVHEYSDLTAVAIDNDRQAARIRHLAQHDTLTGLPNRAMFKELLDHAIDRARRHGGQLAAMFIDLDRFKIINDTFGHDVGDAVLCEIAERLKQALRSCDRVARMGGDEFFVLVDDLESAEAAALVAQRVLQLLALPLVLGGGQEHVLSASIGIAVCPRDGETSESLLKHADIAMYRAKQAGRNGYGFFAEADNIHTAERFALQAQLRRALARREFVLHYQPKVDLRSGRVDGVEALVRWQHPERGLVMPGDFIGVAEDCGLIVALGQQVMEMAFETTRHFARVVGRPITTAINLSAMQLASKGLTEEVQELLRCSGADPTTIQFEITESALIRQPEQARGVVETLRGMGFQFALDDFGTGYSSLTYLKRFPVQCVKIDRSFVKDIPGDVGDLAITRAIVAMAHSLGLGVVAEGVETPEQLHALQQMGCDEYQGYYFSRPVDAERAMALMTATSIAA